ncbi:MAG: nucleotidyltransferase family protein [Pseudomonadota bacterium]
MSAQLILQALHTPRSMLTLDLPQWDLLIRQARRGNLLARLHSLLAQEKLLQDVPHQPRQHLEWTRVTADRHAQAVHTEVSRIQQALPGQPVILLKGAAYVVAGLPPGAGRVFSDIDILVPKAQLLDVESALLAHGWMASQHDAYDQRYYREWMHELPPLQHMLRETTIDVHHAILPQTMAVHPDSEALRAAAIPLAGYQNRLVLAPVDMVLHSAAHLFYESELFNGLRDLADLDALLRHFSQDPDFWQRLTFRAGELGLTRCLYYALRYTKMLLRTSVPPLVMSNLDHARPPSPIITIMDTLYKRVLLPDHVSCTDRATFAARKCLYVRGNWLRMPPLKLARHLFHKAFISPRP